MKWLITLSVWCLPALDLQEQSVFPHLQVLEGHLTHSCFCENLALANFRSYKIIAYRVGLFSLSIQEKVQ